MQVDAIAIVDDSSVEHPLGPWDAEGESTLPGGPLPIDERNDGPPDGLIDLLSRCVICRNRCDERRLRVNFADGETGPHYYGLHRNKCGKMLINGDTEAIVLEHARLFDV